MFKQIVKADPTRSFSAAHDSLHATYLTSVNNYEDNGYNECDAGAVANALHALAVDAAEDNCPLLAQIWQELAEQYIY